MHTNSSAFLIKRHRQPYKPNDMIVLLWKIEKVGRLDLEIRGYNMEKKAVYQDIFAPYVLDFCFVLDVIWNGAVAFMQANFQGIIGALWLYLSCCHGA